MASPYDALLGNLHDPLGQLLRGGFAHPREPAVPYLSPEEQDSLLGGVMEKSLGGLAYLGKVADKTFGGRALRGVLGGHPEELLSVLPFSDTLGLTDEKNTVTGQDLNAQWGLTTPGDESLGNLAAGLGTEILLDPSTYVGLGPLTKAGLLARKAGAALPKGLAPGMRGFDVAESAIKPTLAPGLRPQDVIGAPRPHPTIPGMTVTHRGETMLPEAAEQAGVHTGEPLRALLGLGFPFAQPAVTFGTGPTAQRVARTLDRVGQAAAASAPVRAIRAAVDPEAGGAFTRQGQQLAADILRPEQRAIGRDVREAVTGFRQQADPLLEKNPQVAAEVLRQAGESYRQEAVERALLGGFTPQEADALADLGEKMGGYGRGFLDPEQARGLNTRPLDDASEYFARTKNVLPRTAKEGLFGGLARQFQEFSTTHGSQIGRDEVFQNIPGGTVTINDWAKSDYLRKLSPLNRAKFLEGELVGAGVPLSPASLEAAQKQAKQLSDLLETLPTEHVTQKQDFFRTDPFSDLEMRGLRSGRAQSGAETVFEGIKRYAGKIGDFQKEGTDFVPVEEVFKKLALDKTPYPGGQPIAHEIAATRLGLPNLNELKDYALPADVARDVMKLGQAWENPRQLTPLLAAADWASNLFKTAVTVPFPAFHTRNVLSGIFNMWRDDLSPGQIVSGLKAAYNVLRGGDLKEMIPQLGGRTAAENTQALVRAAVADRVAFTHEAGRAADTAPAVTQNVVQRAPRPGGSGGNLLQDVLSFGYNALPERGKLREQLNPLNVAGVNRAEDTFFVTKAGRKVQSTLDDWLQLGHYIAKLKQGFDPATAGLSVKRYHNDYADLTSTERNILKRVIPWYSFSRKTLPPLLEDFASKPAKVAGALRATSHVRTPGEFVPEYVAEGASVPLPGAPEGQKRYLSSFGLPVEDESLKALGSFAQGDFTRGIQSLLGMSQPLVKAPLEYATGRQFFSGRRLEDLREYNTLKEAGLLDEQNGRVLTQFLANTPASRFLSTADKLTDERKGTLPTLFNLLTGARVTDVDAERSRDIAAKQLLGESLRGKPGVRVAEDVYVPAEKLPLLDPLEMQLYQAYRTASRDVQKRNKERREKELSAGAR